MIAAQTGRIGDHTMFANGCFVGDADHRYDDPETPITRQGFTSKGPVRIGSNCWFGVNCVGHQRRDDRRPLRDRRQLGGHRATCRRGRSPPAPPRNRSARSTSRGRLSASPGR